VNVYRRATHLVLSQEEGEHISDANWLLECGHTAAVLMDEGLTLIELGRPVRCPGCSTAEARDEVETGGRPGAAA
jgi:hypothetical protein